MALMMLGMAIFNIYQALVDHGHTHFLTEVLYFYAIFLDFRNCHLLIAWTPARFPYIPYEKVATVTTCA
jgi:hypothetical protein